MNDRLFDDRVETYSPILLSISLLRSFVAYLSSNCCGSLIKRTYICSQNTTTVVECIFCTVLKKKNVEEKSVSLESAGEERAISAVRSDSHLVAGADDRAVSCWSPRTTTTTPADVALRRRSAVPSPWRRSRWRSRWSATAVAGAVAAAPASGWRPARAEWT